MKKLILFLRYRFSHWQSPGFTTQVFSSSDPPPKTTTPEEFIRMTKGITMATAKAVAAGNSCRQEDIIAMANLSRRAIADMLHSCKVHGRFMQHNCLVMRETADMPEWRIRSVLPKSATAHRSWMPEGTDITLLLWLACVSASLWATLPVWTSSKA